MVELLCWDRGTRAFPIEGKSKFPESLKEIDSRNHHPGVKGIIAFLLFSSRSFLFIVLILVTKETHQRCVVLHSTRSHFPSGILRDMTMFVQIV